MNILEYAIAKKLFGGPGGGTSGDDELIGKWVLNTAPLDMSYLPRYLCHFEGVIKTYVPYKAEDGYSPIVAISNLNSGSTTNLGTTLFDTTVAFVDGNGNFINDFNGELDILAVDNCTDEFKAWLKANATKVS